MPYFVAFSLSVVGMIIAMSNNLTTLTALLAVNGFCAVLASKGK